jgi:hypothetical protein
VAIISQFDAATFWFWSRSLGTSRLNRQRGRRPGRRTRGTADAVGRRDAAGRGRPRAAGPAAARGERDGGEEMASATRVDDGTVANDARFSGGHRDCGLPDDIADQAVVESTPEAEFSGMSAEQRFMMDVHGYIRVTAVVPPNELGPIEEAFERLRGDEPNDVGFGVRRGDPLADPELEALATHPAILNPMLEMMLGRPRLVGSSLWHDLPASGNGMAGPLHSQRERDRRYVSFGARPPGRISCDNVVVFVYLDPVQEDDGGLCVLPGSHKSEFCRPRTLFDSYGLPTGRGYQGPAPPSLPDGLIHCSVAAGDALIGVHHHAPEPSLSLPIWTFVW